LNYTSLISGVQFRGTSNIVYVENVSDLRLKENIKDEEYGLDFVDKQRIISYCMKGDPTIHHGWGFQYVKKHVRGENDSLARRNSSGYGGVDANGMTAITQLAVQQLHAKVKRLEALIAQWQQD